MYLVEKNAVVAAVDMAVHFVVGVVRYLSTVLVVSRTIGSRDDPVVQARRTVAAVVIVSGLDVVEVEALVADTAESNIAVALEDLL